MAEVERRDGSKVRAHPNRMPFRLCDPGVADVSHSAFPDHGGEVWEISEKLGVAINKLFDFSSNVNPLGCSPLAKMAMRRALTLASFYPDNECTQLKKTIASYIGQIESSNVCVGNGATEIIHLFARAFIQLSLIHI